MCGGQTRETSQTSQTRRERVHATIRSRRRGRVTEDAPPPARVASCEQAMSETNAI